MTDTTRRATIDRSNRFRVILALLSVYIIWGSTYLAIRIAIAPGGLPPFTMAGVRFILAGSALYLFLRLRGAAAPTRAQWGGSALIGALLLVGGNGGVTFAEQWVPSGLAALAVGTIPLWAALFSGLFGRWPVRFEWLGLVLGFIGLVLLNLEGDMRANPLGAFVLLISPICWALGSILSRKVSLPAGLMGSASEMLVGGVLLTVLGLVLGERVTDVPTVPSLLALLYLVVFGSIVAFSAYVYLLEKVRPALATSYAYANPVVAVALGVGLAGEQITVFGLVAMVVILIGVAMVVLARARG